MAVQTSALLSPSGRLVGEIHFPGKSAAQVEEKLAGFLTDATARAGEITDDDASDRFVTAWAYYRAFDEVYQRLALMPASVADSDEGSSSYLVTQIEMVRDLRDEMKDEADAILVEEAVEEDEAFTIVKSLRD